MSEPARLRRAAGRAVNTLLRPAGVQLVARPPDSANPFGAPEPAGRYLNVGAAYFGVPGWKAIDKLHSYYAGGQRYGDVIDLDLLDEPDWPLVDGSLRGVYTSHLLEHLSDAAAAKVLSEAHRVLEPGGLLRVCVPDAGRAAEACLAGDRAYFTAYHALARAGVLGKYHLEAGSLDGVPTEDLFMHHVMTQRCARARPSHDPVPAAEVAKALRRGSLEAQLARWAAGLDWDLQRQNPQMHCNGWTERKLLGALAAAGFREAWRCGYLQSRDPVMRVPGHFDSTEPTMTLYVEARKAAGAARRASGRAAGKAEAA